MYIGINLFPDFVSAYLIITTEKRFTPSLDFTETFFCNKNVQVPKFQSSQVKITYDTNFNKIFD